MYVGATLMMGFMSPVQEIVDLGAQCLRIEAWAEPLYAVSNRELWSDGGCWRHSQCHAS